MGRVAGGELGLGGWPNLRLTQNSSSAPLQPSAIANLAIALHCKVALLLMAHSSSAFLEQSAIAIALVLNPALLLTVPIFIIFFLLFSFSSF